MLDVGTLFFSALAAQTMLTLILAVVFAGRYRDGMVEWTLAGALEIAGWLIFLFSALLPKWTSAVLATVLLSACLSLSYLSLKRFFREPAQVWLMVVFPLACAVQQALYFWDSPARIIFSNAVLGTQALICSRQVLFPRDPGNGRSRYIIAIGYTVFALSLFARVIFTAWWPGDMPNLHSPAPINVVVMLTSFLTVVLINVGFLMLHQDRAWSDNLELAMRDALTGALNRRAFRDSANREVALAQRHGTGVAVLMLDLDFFKKLNDSLGHPVGDAALQLFARVLRAEARKSDWVARYGGEEFCVLLPNGKANDAQQFAQRVRAQLLLQPLQPGNTVLHFSGGVSEWVAGEDSLDPAIARADAALYQAKQMGRDRVCVAAMA